jgi:hypothetical protein
VLRVQLAENEVFVVHTHPVMVSNAKHFRLDIGAAGKHVEAVIDWSGQITFYNKAGVKNPMQNGIVEPLEGYRAAFMDERGNVIGFAKVDIVDGPDGTRIRVRK